MYYLLFGFLYLLSLLPLKVLYLLSDLAYFTVYHVMGYRKAVVLQNLTIAFPEKTDAERTKIAKAFYHNFTDTFIETIKLISVGKSWFLKHCTGDPSVFHQLHQENKIVQVHCGHNFNWELANLAITQRVPYTLLGVYMPIKNKPIDRLFKYIRSRTGTVPLPATNMREAMLPYRHVTYALGLVADQNPGNPKAAYWMPFFGRPTPFLKGPEKGARHNSTAVVFCHFTKQKRGYYKAHFTLATTNAHDLPEGALTRQYVKYLEATIRANPDMWLWSHRRWKWDWKPEYGPVMQ